MVTQTPGGLTELETLIDEQKFTRFNLALVLWSFLALLADGFDIAALASAAPALARAWHVVPKSFGPALSASLVGILLGAPGLGFVGDRFGRRPAVVAGSIIFGLGTLATAAAANISQVVILRFVTGIGIGGLMPNLIALNSELHARRWRATMVVLMFTGITAGGSLPGLIQAWLIPHFGWQVMFIIGGALPLLIALCVGFTLPESVKFLSMNSHRRAEFISVLRRVRPDVPVDRLESVASGSSAATLSQTGGSGLAQIMRGELAILTPLLWLCFMTALMMHFFLTSWLPLIFETHGMPARAAGMTTSLYHLGGAFGGVAVSLLLARFGFAVIAVLFLAAIPAVIVVGQPALSQAGVALAAAVAGFFVLGTQFGNNAAAGLLYPTPYRSRGVGWTLGVGRFGSILGPMLGATLLGMKLPLETLFLIAAAPMVVGLLAAGSLAWVSYRRHRSLELGDSY